MGETDRAVVADEDLSGLSSIINWSIIDLVEFCSRANLVVA